jgi:hypothetical protein
MSPNTLQEARLLLNSQTSLSLNGKLCALRAYRLEARRDVPNPYKSPDPWVDKNAAVLQEYRLSGLPCASATSFTASSFPLLDLVDPSVSLFALVSSPHPGVDVALRLKARSGSRVVYAPRGGAAYGATPFGSTRGTCPEGLAPLADRWYRLGVGRR